MLRFIVRRVLLMIPTLFVISALVYFIIDLPPGDCVTAQVDELLSRGQTSESETGRHLAQAAERIEALAKRLSAQRREA